MKKLTTPILSASLLVAGLTIPNPAAAQDKTAVDPAPKAQVVVTIDATVLAGDSPEAFNDVERPNRVVPEKTKLKLNEGVVKLPPHSLTIIRIR